MVFFLLCDDRNYILIQNLLDNHDRQNYQKILSRNSVKILGIESIDLSLDLPSIIPTPSTIAI